MTPINLAHKIDSCLWNLAWQSLPWELRDTLLSKLHYIEQDTRAVKILLKEELGGHSPP